jgi:hypothetical protein
MDPKRDLLRHALATIAYRGARALRGAPESFAAFSAADAIRTPVQIVAHLGDLFDWAVTIAAGAARWHTSVPLAWEAEVARFFAALGQLDAQLASADPLACPPEQLLQGPIADALTHVGQLMMLRRMAGLPARSENYFKADIASGRVGAAQTPPRFEFD